MNKILIDWTKREYQTKSLDINNFLEKLNLKIVKTLKDSIRNSLQNSAFTILKFNFSKKLLISKLLV